MLTENDGKVLLAIARTAIQHCVENKPYHCEPREEKALNKRSGCFVTIKKDGQLRGCIGNFQGREPLFKDVESMAIASATQDPRFPAMTPDDLANFNLEITVLSPLEKIEDTAIIEIGRHGIYIEQNFRRGVLLPQVAIEHGWDRNTFLEQTCSKAGLPKDAWRSPDSDIYIFSGQIVTET